MVNVALQFRAVRERGLTLAAPDGIENLARYIANQPTREDAQRVARKVRDVQSRAVADEVMERARALRAEGSGGT